MPRRPGDNKQAIKRDYEAGMEIADIETKHRAPVGTIKSMISYGKWKRTGEKPKGTPPEELVTPMCITADYLGKTTKDNRERIIEGILKGGTQTVAAAAVGIKPNLLKEWFAREPRFEAECAAARANFLLSAEHAIGGAVAEGDAAMALHVLERDKLTSDSYSQKPSGSTEFTFNFGWDRGDAPTIDVTPTPKLIEGDK